MIYEAEIKKIEAYLPHEKNVFNKLKQMDALRYFYKENENEKERVKYDEETDELVKSRSIEIAEEITKYVPKVLNEIEEENKEEAVKIMKNNYYYLAAYLFSYFAVAIEFGIPAEKQFLAPRTSVLIPIAKKLEKFYYKPKAVMTISMPQGTGKEQPLSSKILTPDGWITMGEVKVGTKVIGADGSICNVTGVFPKGVKDVYRVTFDDHTYVDCGLEHLWEVKDRKDRGSKRPARIVNTEQMLKDFKIKDDWHVYNNYSVRLMQPAQFDSQLKEDDIKPYILGTLIANGNLTQQNITFSTADEEVVQKVESKLPNNCRLSRFKNPYVFGLYEKETRKNQYGNFIQTYFVRKIKEYELFGKKSDTKFIPKKYLYANINERIELLRGLMDGDGTISETGQYSYTTTSEQLKDDILELIRGLGGKASATIGRGYYKNKNNEKKYCKYYYKVHFVLNINPFYTTRKTQRYKKPTYNYQKMIVNIEKVRQEECQCIMIDHPEHLYVTDGYTLTHNTELGKRFMSFCVGKEPSSPCMMVSYSASIAKRKIL